MSIAARFSLLLTATIVLLGTVVAAATANREYDQQIHGLANRTQALVTGTPALQYHIYQSDRSRLEQTLATLVQDEAVGGAQVFNGLGERLAAVERPGARQLPAASFTRVRDKMYTLDVGWKFYELESGAPQPITLAASLLNSGSALHHSLPVFTEVNAGAAGLTAGDFAIAFTSRSDNISQRVIGYVHFLIDPAALNAAALRAGLRLLLFNALFASLCGVLAWFLANRLTRPLRQLAEMADAVSSGDVSEPLKVEGSGELQEITRLLNSVIEGAKDTRKVHEIDKQLLSLKVQERSSQLSERNEALTKAVAEANQTRDRLQRVSNYDQLTKLPNRQLFTEQLDLLLKLNQRNGHTLALLFIDLEDYKRVNDSLGISAGDQLLVEVGQRLSNTVRDSDSVGHLVAGNTRVDVARLGGDEFTVILNQLDSPESARAAADRLLASLTLPMEIEGHTLVLHPSVGIAIAPTDGKDVESLLKAASTAKFHARQGTGDTRIAFYRSNMAHQEAERLRLESDLRNALGRGEFSLHYQPQVDTHSGSVVGAEALLRWEHPQLGQVPPARFVTIAEDMGLMEELGDWVLQEACAQLAHFNREGLKLGKMAINISAEQFSPGFVDKVSKAIKENGIAPDQLELGLTEAVMSSNDPDTMKALRTLRDSGVYLSVDDFGTGYSPLNYLGHYPLDELKIGRGFLQEASRSQAGARLVIGIIAMAQSLSLKVLATGVEKESQFHFLTENGAHLIQGYLFSKPVPAEEFKHMLAPWHFGDMVRKLADSPNREDGGSPESTS